MPEAMCGEVSDYAVLARRRGSPRTERLTTRERASAAALTSSLPALERSRSTPFPGLGAIRDERAVSDDAALLPSPWFPVRVVVFSSAGLSLYSHARFNRGNGSPRGQLVAGQLV